MRHQPKVSNSPRTLGTGMAPLSSPTAILCSSGLELGHHPWKTKTYEDYLGAAASTSSARSLEQIPQAAIRPTSATFNWNLYIGGGNTSKITFDPGPDVKIVSNESRYFGGVALWREWTRIQKRFLLLDFCSFI